MLGRLGIKPKYGHEVVLIKCLTLLIIGQNALIRAVMEQLYKTALKRYLF